MSAFAGTDYEEVASPAVAVAMPAPAPRSDPHEGPVPYGTTPAAKAHHDQTEPRQSVVEDQVMPTPSTGRKWPLLIALGFGLLFVTAVLIVLAAVIANMNTQLKDKDALLQAIVGRQADRWYQITPKGSSPPPRLAGASVGTQDRYLWIHGGLYGTANETYSDLWRYDNYIDTWQQMATTGDVPSGRLHHSLVSVDDSTLLLFGGFNVFNTQSTHASYTELYKLDLGRMVWTRLDTAITGVKPSPRGAHNAVYANGYMFIFGGFFVIGAAGQYNELWRYNPRTNVWFNATPPVSPEGRIGMAMASVGTKIFMYGGGCASAGQCGGTWVYDTLTSQWSNLAPTSEPVARRASPGDGGVYDAMYVYGGVNISVVNGAPVTNMLDDLWAYVPQTNRWVQLFPDLYRTNAARPPKTFGHSVTRLGSSLVIFGGRIVAPTSPGSSQVWEYEVPKPPS